MHASRKYGPSDAISARAIHLGESRKGTAECIAHDGRHRYELGAVVNHLVVDLVSKYDQPRALRDSGKRFENGARVDGPGRVVRIDYDDGTRSWSDESGYLFRIRDKAVLRPAWIVHRPATVQRHSSCPQRI